MKDTKNMMVTVSGGRSSVRKARHIQTSEKYRDFNKVYVFCNTGQEDKATIDFLKAMEFHWGIPLVKIEGIYSDVLGEGVGYKIVDWDDLNMSGAPFSGAIMHKNKGVYDGLPHSGAPYCSDMLKTRPAKKLCDDLFGVNNYIKSIGFRAEDMPKRITWAEIKSDESRIFPLITDFDAPVTQKDLNRWWAQQPFQLQLHGKYGNCQLCWKKSDANLIEVIRRGTRFIDWYREMESKYGNVSFRGNKSIDDLVKLAALPTTIPIDFGDDDKCVCNF